MLRIRIATIIISFAFVIIGKAQDGKFFVKEYDDHILTHLLVPHIILPCRK